MSKFYYNNHRMRCVTIKQPIAFLIVSGKQDIENRTWKIKLNQNPAENWFLVHSSKKINIQKPISSIIGMMHIRRIESISNISNNIWATGPYCWILDAVIKLNNPIFTIGHQKVWDPPENIHEKLQKEIKNSLYNLIFFDHHSPQNNIIIEKFFLTYTFPSNFINIIIADKYWDNNNIIKQYFKHLPKNSKIITRNSKSDTQILKQTNSLNLDTVIFKANWKTGKKAGIERDLNLINFNPKSNLITIFTNNINNQNHFIQNSKKLKIQTLIISNTT